MRVLMPECDTPGAAAAADRLRDAGHTVVTCHDGNDGWCIALRGQRCPLETNRVDIALLVRPTPTMDRLPREEGVTCAVARRIPLVVAGSSGGHPSSRWTVTDEEGSDVTRTLETVLAEPMPEHTITATAALRAAFTTAGVDPGGSWAPVYRRNGGLLVDIVLGATVDPSTPTEVAAVRIAGALRTIDPWSASIDVRVAQTQ
jgi:hypothetical protein